jgi:hypothetical protein
MKQHSIQGSSYNHPNLCTSSFHKIQGGKTNEKREAWDYSVVDSDVVWERGKGAVQSMR